jgi:Ca-activated chloride channel family protein
MLDLQYPWLLVLLVLPWLFKARRPTPKAGLKFQPLQHLLRRHPELGQSNTRPSQPWRFIVIWSALVIAGAQPVWLGEPVEQPQQGRDMMLAVDLSGSMNIADMQVGGKAVDRLTAVKAVLRDFIAKRQGDRLGLILFADAAYQQTPLTFDHATVQQLLDEASLNLVGSRTAIGEAIGLAVKRFNNYERSNKVLILLSDGANTTGQIQPREALTLAKAAGIRIYTIGIGADVMVRQDIFGSSVVNPSSDLDEALLTELANSTGGQYFRARNPQELEAIYNRLNELEPIERDKQTARPEISLLHWPLALVLLAWLLPLLWQRLRLARWRQRHQPHEV